MVVAGVGTAPVAEIVAVDQIGMPIYSQNPERFAECESGSLDQRD